MTVTRTPRGNGSKRAPVTKLPGVSARNEHRVLKGALALLGSLALLVGVPVLLVLLVGNPLPTEAPSRDWLTADVSAAMVIDVLAVLVWIVWVHFVVCFLTEWRAIRAGRMPERVVMGGGSQTLARQLVAGILLLAGGASIASGVSSAVAADHRVEQQSARASISQVAQSVAQSAEQSAAAGEQQVAQPGTAAQLKMTTVKLPEGRHHDTLWGIAERTLGDPFRYKEIFQLNKDRVQPDGSRLTDADLIKPGWNLVLPADASGPGVVLASVPTTPATPPGTASTASGGDAAGGTTARVDSADQVLSRDQSESPSEGQSGLGSILLGGGLVLAGVLRALTAKRGPFGEPDEAAAELAAAANVRRAELLDNALRSLAESRAAHDLPMPELLFAYLNDEQVVLHLRSELADAPAPWTVSEDRKAWTLRASDLVLPGSGVPAPYPSLVTVATSHGYDLLIDLEQAPGLVSLGGNGEVAREVAMAMALDLATHTWSDGLQVLMVGFGDHYVDLDTGRVRRADNLSAVLDELDRDHTALGAAMARIGVTGVLQGRQRGVRETRPTVLFLSGAPTSEEAQRLVALTGGGRTPVSVVCVGDTASARWRFGISDTGQIEATVLGISGEARRLDVAAQRRLRELLAAATSQRGLGVEELENSSAAALARKVATESAATAEPAADGAGASRVPVAEAGVSLRLLGPVAVEGAGEVPRERRDLLTEVVAIAALHPDGVHPVVLRASLWPRGVEDDVVEARLADVTAWLGTTADGRDRFVTLPDGRLQLRDVAVDYADLAAAAQAQGAEELDRLVAALDAGTGPVFSGAGSRYSWLVFVREARRCRLLVAAVARRAAELAVTAGRVEVAEHALRQGLELVPTAQVLWRTLLRLQAQHDPSTVDRTVAQMYSSLTGCGVEHEPETEALVKELAPQRERAAGS